MDIREIVDIGIWESSICLIGTDTIVKLTSNDYGELIYIRDLSPYDQQKEIKSHITRRPDLEEQYLRYLEIKNNSVKK